MSASTEADGGARARVTGVLLAGGRARRMGGTDKGLVEVAGRPMAAHVLARLGPQVAAVVVNANRNRARYAALGVEVVADTLDGYLGPLAGLLAGMQAAATELVVSAPCDSPFVPPDLVARLVAGLDAAGADVAVPHDGERQQTAVLLARTALAEDLHAWLAGGGRKIDAWFGRLAVADVDFRDRPEAFLNINTPEERADLEARLLAGDAER